MKKITALIIFIAFATMAFTGCSVLSFGEDIASTDNVEKQSASSESVGIITDEAVCESVANLGAKNADGDVQTVGDIVYQEIGYVNFGYYPQTVAEKKAIKEMSTSMNGEGYYVSKYDNEKYAKIAVPDVYAMYESGYEFSDEKKIKEETTYYFKVEPIKWRVFGVRDITGQNKALYLVSETILDSTAFLQEELYAENPSDGAFYQRTNGKTANDYVYSSLRKYLNESFFKTAFGSLSEEDKAKLIGFETESGTDGAEAVSDPVTVMTVAQAKTLSLALRAQASDYARCKGTFMCVYPEYYGNGRYWLKDGGKESYRAAFVSDSSGVNANGESVGSTFVGVRPVISLGVDETFEILQDEEEG